MNKHEKDWLSSRAYGDVFDLWQDCAHIHHDDIEEFKKEVRDGVESAFQALIVPE